MLTQEQLNENYERYTSALNNFIGEECTNSIISMLGGEEKVKNAVFGNTADSGSAYNGSLIENLFKISQIALKITNAIPTELQPSKNTLFKVILLSHISKVLMFVENDNNWEKTNRGILYKFEDLNGALRTGERSALIAMNAGVRFTEEEYEAMLIMDKSNTQDNYSKFFSTPLSTIIRQANELVTMINKKS